MREKFSRGEKKQVRAVATALRKEKILSGGRVREIMNRVQTGDTVIIRIIDKNGNERKIFRKHIDGQPIMLGSADLPKAVNDNEPVAEKHRKAA